MRNFAILVASLVAIAAGVGIGCIPVVNENLHWNIWLVVPISGFILGMALGGLQFGVAYVMGAPVRSLASFVLGAAAVVAYVGTDLGTWLTLIVPVSGVDGLPDGDYPLRDFLSFGEYMSAKLESTSIASRGSSEEELHFGAMGTMISFGIDLAGAFAGAMVSLRGAAAATPYCHRCTRYKKREQLRELPLGEDLAVEQLDQLQEIVARADYAGIVSHLNEIAKGETTGKETVKLRADERVCPGCNQATLMAKVLRKHGREWKEVGELSFRLESSAGETTRLARTA